jgi:DNA-binding XRE family transcriptional regulator
MINIIYGLADSRNDLVYYIGKSTVGSVRAISHLNKSHSPEVNKWIESVVNDYGNIKVVLIEQVEDIHLLSDREKYWIGFCKTANHNLLNKNDLPHLIESYKEDDDLKFSELKNTIIFAGDIIKKRRLALNVTQQVLSDVSGVNRWTLGQIENEKDITLLSLKKIILGLVRLSIDKNLEHAPLKQRSRCKHTDKE